MVIIGIDPGATGALAFYDTQMTLPRIRVIDMPVAVVKRGKRLVKEVDPAQLVCLIQGELNPFGGKIHAYLEKVGAMPGQGVSSMFAFGRSVGMVEGVLAGLMVPVSYVASQTWVRVMQVRGGKGGSRLRASELFPAQSDYFARVMDHGRADACLIAMFGAKQ